MYVLHNVQLQSNPFFLDMYHNFMFYISVLIDEFRASVNQKLSELQNMKSAGSSSTKVADATDINLVDLHQLTYNLMVSLYCFIFSHQIRLVIEMTSRRSMNL